jgi:hypothetical protein
MQLGQLLAVLNPTPAASGSNVSGAGADGGSADQTFAQLLGDAGAKNAASDQGGQQDGLASEGEHEVGAVPASTALTAQELNNKDAEDATALAEKIAQPITSDEAAAMLARLEAKGASGAFIEQLKRALMGIRDGSGHESIASLVQKLAEAQKAASPADVAAMIQQTMQAMAPEHASDKEADESQSVVADEHSDSVLSVLAQSLQASFFRSMDGQPHTASAHTAEQERKEESWNMVEIIPLSATLVMNGSGISAPLQGASSADESAVSMGNSISSLALAAEAKDALPSVNLPSAALAGEEKNSATLDALSALKSANDARLNAALDAAKTSVDARSSAAAIAANSMHSQSSQPASPAMNAAALVAAPPTTKTVVNPLAAPAVSETTGAANTNAMKPLSAVMAASNRQSLAAEEVVAETPAEQKPLDIKLDGVPSDVSLTGAESPIAMQKNAESSAVKLAAYVPIPAPEQVHVAVSHAIKTGIRDVTIQLDPVDLGRVEVSMHTNADGQTQITFMVDKPSTLDSLARSAHGLERSLQEAGVKTDAGNMQFNLRQQPQSADTNAGGNGNRQSSNQSMKDDAIASIGSTNAAAISAIATRNYTLTMRDGLDIRA